MRAVKIYAEPENLRLALKRWKEIGIDTLMAGNGCFASEERISLFRDEGLRLSFVEPVFLADESSGTERLARDFHGRPAADGWVRFACPTDEAFLSGVYRRLESHAALHPDGMSLDFIRFFQFWEMVPPDAGRGDLVETCSCPRCREAFLRYAEGRPFPQLQEAWRRSLISSVVRKCADVIRAVSPETKIGLHVVPWLSSDYGGSLSSVLGQDLCSLAGIGDYLTPMVYHRMMGRPVSFIRELVADQVKNSFARVPVVPCIQVGSPYGKPPLGVAEFSDAVRAAQASPSGGLALYCWDDLLAEPGKIDALRVVLREA